MIHINSMRWNKMIAFSLGYSKYEIKHPKYTHLEIRNQNLWFEDLHNKCQLRLTLIYPQLYLKGSSYIGTYNYKSIISFGFIETPLTKSDEGEKIKEQNRISLNYQQLSKILQVDRHSNQEEFINKKNNQANNKSKFKSLQVKDIPNLQCVNLLLRCSDEKIVTPELVTPEIDFKLKYSHYRLMQSILKKSLYDLSGIHLSQQLKKREDQGQLTDIVYQHRKQTLKQSKQFYGDSQ